MHPNRAAVRGQQRALEAHARASDAPSFLELLSGPDLHETLESLLPEHRQRLYPPTETLAMFLAQALASDRSCQRAVNERAVGRLSAGLAPCSLHTGAYCQARQRLPSDLVIGLARRSGRLLHERALESWRWLGRRVIVVDGTTLSMPDTEANQARFPQHGSQQPGQGYPLARVLGLFCLSSGALLDAASGAFGGKGNDEHSQLRTLLDNLERDDVLLGDANFPSYWLLAELRARGVEGVFEQMGGRRRHTDFRRGERLGRHDHVIELVRPQRPRWMSAQTYACVPRTLCIRETRVGRAKRTRVLVTTMLSAEDVSKGALERLYLERWRVELDLRNLKTTLGMDVLSCRTPEMIVKEIWVYLLAYNLLRVLMAQAARAAGATPRQLSFKHTVQIWCAWGRRGHAIGDEGVGILLGLIGAKRVGRRPGRVEPRAVKRRPKCFRRLWAPRRVARRQIRYR